MHFSFPARAQHVGMGRKLIERFPRAKELYTYASEVLGFDLAQVCAEGPKERLDSTVVSQPAIYVTSLAALELVKAESPELIENCSYSAGLSLGEYTALVFAGALSFEEGLKLVKYRGEVMQAAADATPSTMASVLMLDAPQVEGICEQASDAGLVRAANYLCPGNTAISGVVPAVDRAVTLAEEAGAKVVRLAVAGAFHTDIMQPADQQMRSLLEQTSFGNMRIPVVSNVDAAAHTNSSDFLELLVNQVIRPVRWEQCMRTLIDNGVDDFHEVGPGRVLSGLLKRIRRKIASRAWNDSE